MARHFPDWITAYREYAEDKYCPSNFHLWTGFSVLAGALERKVWTVNGKIVFHPNLFVFLVTYAGVGKSTALLRGMDFLERIKEEVNPQFKIIAEQATEPALVKNMEERQEIYVSETSRAFHSSGYFCVSEASLSALQNTHGSFTATLTGFYDCPRVFRKITKGEHETPTEIRNVCFNVLAGATFDYLQTLVNESSVMGGFASRIIYVISKERLIRTPKWGESDTNHLSTQNKLFEDLVQIHKLQGAFRPSKGFTAAWEKFQPESDKMLAQLNSPRLESLAARKSTHTMKVAMLVSISESNDLTLEVRHWDKAMELVDEVSKDNAFILSQGAMADKTSQMGVTQMIGQTLKRNGGELPMKVLKGIALSSGHSIDSVGKTLDFMLSSNWISLAGDGGVKLLIDPDRYL